MTTSEHVDKRLFFGLDLGQAQDYTALSIIERVARTGDVHFNCVHLQRWMLKTPYPSIVADVCMMVRQMETDRRYNVESLSIDATGVGAPVVDLFRTQRLGTKIEAIQIVAGSTVSSEHGVTRVPKRDLVSVVQVALQNKTLQIAKQLREAETLVSELSNFQVKITDSANDVYGAWRTGTHDDLVLSVSLALWQAVNYKPRTVRRNYGYFFQNSY